MLRVAATEGRFDVADLVRASYFGTKAFSVYRVTYLPFR